MLEEVKSGGGLEAEKNGGGLDDGVVKVCGGDIDGVIGCGVDSDLKKGE